LIETMFVTALLLLAAGMAVPQLTVGIDRARGLGAARYLAGQMALARSEAVRRSSTVALRFEKTSDGIVFAVFVDGDGNGVRARDIEAEVDWQVRPPTRLSDLFPGVAIDLVPELSESSSVQLGGSSILSFTPAGTATSGTVHVLGKDGTQWAVRVLGATARTRVLRYVPGSSQWIEAF
jgi:Tfp pilus assembly protein FimT